MIKKVIRIFKRCVECPFCIGKHIKEVTGYYIRYICLRSDYKEINRKELLAFPEWCPLGDETIVNFAKVEILDIRNKKVGEDDETRNDRIGI